MRRRRRPSPTRALVAIALLAALGPAGAAALDEPPPGSGGALRIVADPPRLLLGRDGAAELRIHAPAEVEELSISTNAGRVEGLRRLAGGGFAARYRPPAERYPLVAIVAATGRTARGPVDGWLALPLSGQGDARVRSQPGQEISLRIGDRTFGPRRAGPDGLAVIPVVVPPGVREAHHGFRPVDLHVPETSLVHAVADHVAVHADQAEHVRVLAYVVAPHGAARRGDVPAFEASRGSVSAVAREPGAFEAIWTLPAGAVGEDRLVVRLPGSPASRAVIRLDAVAGPPATVAVTFDREAVVAGSVEEVGVTARVLDAAGNAVDAPVELAAAGGTLSAPAPAGVGAVAARLRVRPGFGGRGEVVITARAPAAGISGSRALPLQPGPPARARFSPDDAVLLADGHDAALRVTVLDRYDNPVRAVPAVSARRGSILGVEPDGEGTWRVRYRAPAVPSRTGETVLAQVGQARATAELLLVPPRGPAILPTAGVLWDLRGRFTAASAGLATELPMRGLLPPTYVLAWRLEAGVLGFDGHRDLRATGSRGEPIQLSADAPARGLTLLGGATVRRELRRGPELWGSLAAGALLGRVDPDGAARDAGAAPALRATLGVGWPFRYATPFLEASLLAAGRSPLGALAAAGLSAGVRFDLPEATWRRSSSSTTSP
ncbi:conserved hypothetical protein [Anaeromyxobacter sp. K]|nr:conserved hypothetical protein [Anaeromyxobacter sp. K]